ncbi:AraC family transcriptional regulator ligand-binding domain-containing protein [Sorangium sp. So ce291]|uniref:helix-turn-helix transcriptional regulator n=1 Tax=Sorangium sp. So ce291 TaxID=3133294 RepID=UPI003F5D62A4
MPDGELVFASIPAALIAFASSRGVPRGDLVRAAGVAPEALAAPDELVPYDSLLSLWELLLQRLPGEPLGLQYSRWIPVSVVGVVGHVLRHSETLRQGIAAYGRFCRLMDPYLRITVEERGGAAHLALEHEPRVVAMAEPIELMVSALARFIALYLDGAARPIEAGAARPIEAVFRHARRHPPALYEEVLGAPARFEAPATGLVYDARVLDAPVVGADPSVRDYLVRHAEQLLAARAAPPGGDALPGGAASPGSAAPLDARVRARIDERLDRGDVDQERIARSLGMSTRSLQRALKDLGTSFTAQLDEARRGKALDLIRRRDLALQEIAFLLGYVETRHFYRSFRRWTGTTPGEYRRTGAR